jgi:exopolysaccharide production protein ExoZ
MRQQTRLHGLQYLRAIAAIMVAVFHIGETIPAYSPYLGGIHALRLWTGVDVFFVISGFIMTVTGARLAPGEFVVRRLIRIVPLYWLLTSLLAVMTLHKDLTTVESYILSLLFVPYRDANGSFQPLLGTGWTLNYEMFFYAIFALVLWVKPQRPALLTGLLLGSLVALGAVLPGFYTSPMLLEFWLGILIARTYEHVRLPTAVSVGLILAGFAGLMLTAFVAVHEIGAAAIVLGTVVWERSGKLRLWQPGVALGDASYSLYLTHTFALSGVKRLWLALLPEAGMAGALGFAIVSMIAVFPVALACYRWVEAPITAALHRRWVTRAPVRAEAPPARVA